jgi:DNA-binding CsgD family transcriptional regulator
MVVKYVSALFTGQTLDKLFFCDGKMTGVLNRKRGTLFAQGTSLKNIGKFALMQLGAFTFLVTLLFRPEVLVAYAPGDPLLLYSIASVQATIGVMALTGIVCIAVFSRLSTASLKGVLVVQMLTPIALAVLLALLHVPFVQVAVSLILGATVVTQTYLFARFNTLNTSETLLSVGLCLAIAASLSHATFLIAKIHLLGVIVLTLVAAVSAWFIFGQHRTQQQQSWESVKVDDEPLSVFATIRGSIIPGIAILLESLLAAGSLGLTWNQTEIRLLENDWLPFLVGTILEMGFVFVLHLIWQKYSHADFLVIGAAVVASLALVLSIFSEDGSSPTLYVLAVLSEFCFLLLAWIGALVLDKSPVKSGVLTVFYLLVLIVLFGIFMGVADSVSEWLGQRMIALSSLAFLLYMLGYSLQRSRPLAVSVPVTAGTSEIYVDNQMKSKCSSLAEKHSLSPREAELLPFFVVGMSGPAIGRRMFISPETVKTHRKRIYRKLNVTSHDELYDMFLSGAG